jgi:hypothetical protein
VEQIVLRVARHLTDDSPGAGASASLSREYMTARWRTLRFIGPGQRREHYGKFGYSCIILTGEVGIALSELIVVPSLLTPFENRYLLLSR